MTGKGARGEAHRYSDKDASDAGASPPLPAHGYPPAFIRGAPIKQRTTARHQ